VKLFAYLANIDRLCTRANLRYKNCKPLDVCVACPFVETGRNLYFDCQLSAAVWPQLDVPIPVGRFSIWDMQAPPLVSADTWHVGVDVILWFI
jgi:hypothetical protein